MTQPSFQERHKGFGHCLSEDGFGFSMVEAAYECDGSAGLGESG